ncbi:CobD/CbiB family protein [Silvimonas amylolytica]|uniref:Cobalamin biosynthesis protein CobD n=1 Tax=Silvimonas amylolytica TaxID=449663 RepID=A0ABQ2PRQ5_9NEIS|nr:CobD/CbiB family protein [Silvimonas amylolytica]GGP27900.1 cobalamin biosynthesis protein CobD [Silvimonas amylolytica]
MTFLALILALALEQLRPISSRNPAYLAFIRMANNLERSLDAGEFRNGVYGWLLAMIPPLAVSLIVYFVLAHHSQPLAVAWTVAVLYFTMGFRQFSHAFSGISRALQAGETDVARLLLSDWTGQHTSEMSEDEISRVAIEQGLVDSFRYVFGTVFWFVVLCWFAGPAGAVLYRTSSLLAQKWGAFDNPNAFGRFARWIQDLLDYVPVRLTAVSFAIMGDFQDAVDCWSAQARTWADYTSGILLAAGAGAIGIKLGDVLHQDHTVKFRPELGLGDAANPDYLASAVGLIWRSVLLWLALILLISVAHWVS